MFIIISIYYLLLIVFFFVIPSQQLQLRVDGGGAGAWCGVCLELTAKK